MHFYQNEAATVLLGSCKTFVS